MRTRTLLLLAVVCGLAILVAGGIQLLRVTGGGDAADDLAIGDAADAGDLTVTVTGASEPDATMRVEVRLGGVDDPAGIDGFRLVVPGAALAPLSGDQAAARTDDLAAADVCAVLTVAEQTCLLVFDTSGVDGSARVLLARRGEDQVRWTLA